MGVIFWWDQVLIKSIKTLNLCSEGDSERLNLFLLYTEPESNIFVLPAKWLSNDICTWVPSMSFGITKILILHRLSFYNDCIYDFRCFSSISVMQYMVKCLLMCFLFCWCQAASLKYKWNNDWEDISVPKSNCPSWF